MESSIFVRVKFNTGQWNVQCRMGKQIQNTVPEMFLVEQILLILPRTTRTAHTVQSRTLQEPRYVDRWCPLKWDACNTRKGVKLRLQKNQESLWKADSSGAHLLPRLNVGLSPILQSNQVNYVAPQMFMASIVDRSVPYKSHFLYQFDQRRNRIVNFL